LSHAQFSEDSCCGRRFSGDHCGHLIDDELLLFEQGQAIGGATAAVIGLAAVAKVGISYIRTISCPAKCASRGLFFSKITSKYPHAKLLKY